jgi:pimeloyl-ACP methyl ester carboxylesterase
MTQGSVNVLGGPIHYSTMGSGEPLVLLHKLGGRIQEWRRIIPTLASQYRVIAFDLTGHGQSKPQDLVPFIVTQEAMAAQVMAALDALDIAPPYRFVGSSLGGCAAIVCAALWPDQVAGVVSLGSALGGAVTREQAREAAAEAIAMGQFDAQENPLPRPMSYARSAFGLQDEDIAREQNESRAQAGRWIAATSRGVGRFDYLARLPGVKTPVLLAWGERGGYGRFVDDAAARLPRVQKVGIKDSGSFPHEEAPDATAQLIVSFYDESDA